MTGLQDLKYRQWFMGADVDGDGVISRQDVLLMGERFIAACGDVSHSAAAQRLREGLDTFWAQVLAPQDQDGDGRIDLPELTEGFRRALTDPSLYPQQIQPVAECYFDLADLDGNGVIDRSEFEQVFGLAANLPFDECGRVFAALDLDGSGALDRFEFHEALAEFFYGDTPGAAANHLFGLITA
ncbi:EF-hand domain-containing protein [Kitasatospora griseola]|uniref:EF-hand domain-containing protein n=1 Tax=Kitasatospora griseola TaxID=2064 RepID=UPI0034444DE5